MTTHPCGTNAACDCGWTGGPYRSQPQADYALRRHSCDYHRKITARAERVAARKAASGPVRDCHCPIATHQHGTNVAYVIDRCRCRDCRDAATAYERDRSRQRAYGRAAYVPAGQARAHVLHLGRQGMGWKRVAAAADIDTSVIWKLVYGDRARNMPPSRRIRQATHDKVMAVTLDLAPGALVDGTGTRRRLQALHANGWSQTRIAARMGMQIGNYSKIIRNAQGGHVTKTTADKARALYDELWDVTPPAANRHERAGITHARKAALRNGWNVPLAWDDESIDAPSARPHVLTPPAKRNGGRPIEDVIEDIEFLADDGMDVDQVAHRLNLKPNTVPIICRRADRGDLMTHMTRNKTVRENAA